MSDNPPVIVMACCDPDHGKAKDDIFEQPFMPHLISGPHRIPACASHAAVALLSARECSEPKSYRDALAIAQAHEWQAAIQQDYSSVIDNGT
jgi:hypothetical protein